MSKHTPMVAAAARALCTRRCDACGTDFDDEWKLYGDVDMLDAEAALEACGAPELLEALQEVWAWGTDENDENAAAACQKARAAISKALGERA